MKEEKMKNKAKEYIQWQGWQPLGKKLKQKIKKPIARICCKERIQCQKKS